MKILTFKTKESAPDHYRIGALVSEDGLIDLTSIISESDLSEADILKCFDLDSRFHDDAKESIATSGTIELDRVEICSPVPRPGKIICIGLNYRDHAAESGMAIPESPVIFSKFSTCAIGPSTSIAIPLGSIQTDFEAELAVIIGRRAKNVSRAEAMNYVFGYTNFNDVSARDFQFADGQWQRGKSCDTFAPMGPFVATTDEIRDPQNLSIKFRLNGQTLQDSSTNQMIFGVAELVEFLSRHVTLEPGDVIATGTPPGVGFARKPPIYLKAGDVAEVEVEGLGVLSNSVAAS
ncbi:MAG TPA: fumarylacetoacetate hydrolase family protein [Pyrinomonadaceae bacterium]|nr:fumarylacetoacetate hydrolase family protein [Pyrinomonadaceae bacterium]